MWGPNLEALEAPLKRSRWHPFDDELQGQGWSDPKAGDEGGVGWRSWVGHRPSSTVMCSVRLTLNSVFGES